MALDLSRAHLIKGCMDRQELRWLARAARRVLTAIEVGTYEGRSTRALTDHIASGRVVLLPGVFDEQTAAVVTDLGCGHADCPRTRRIGADSTEPEEGSTDGEGGRNEDEIVRAWDTGRARRGRLPVHRARLLVSSRLGGLVGRNGHV
jgi:hypothetical protein